MTMGKYLRKFRASIQEQILGQTIKIEYYERLGKLHAKKVEELEAYMKAEGLTKQEIIKRALNTNAKLENSRKKMQDNQTAVQNLIAQLSDLYIQLAFLDEKANRWNPWHWLKLKWRELTANADDPFQFAELIKKSEVEKMKPCCFRLYEQEVAVEGEMTEEGEIENVEVDCPCGTKTVVKH